MKVLLDTNAVLDVLLARQPWVAAAQAVWRAHDEGLITAFVSASSMTDVYYIVRRLAGAELAREAIRTCIATFEICTVDRAVLVDADRLPGRDFEDNVQIACAVLAALDAIVTRDPRGYADSPIGVLSPDDLLRQLATQTRESGQTQSGLGDSEGTSRDAE